MMRLEFDEEENTIDDVIDELTFYKEIVGLDAETCFKGQTLNNKNLEQLNKLRTVANVPERKISAVEKNLLQAFNAKLYSSKDVVYWINKASTKLDTFMVDEFEYKCYYYLSLKSLGDLTYTIKNACYFLYLLQTSDRDIEMHLDEIMLRADDNFNFDIFASIALEYTNMIGNAYAILNKYIPQIDTEIEKQKIKKLSEIFIQD